MLGPRGTGRWGSLQRSSESQTPLDLRWRDPGEGRGKGRDGTHGRRKGAEDGEKRTGREAHPK